MTTAAALHSAPARALLCGLLVSCADGCRRPPSTVGSSPASVAADSARGVVTLAGSEPGAALLLVPAAGTAGEPIALSGPPAAQLRGLTGLEVMVEGRHTGARSQAAGPRGAALFEVQRFVVRAADGHAAYDGIVTARDGEFYLALADGRRLRVAALPAPLRQKVGARVFLAGPLDRAPTSYGVISERR